MNNICHCEDDLNKIAEIMKKREEKAFKYDCLVRKINNKIEELIKEADYRTKDNPKGRVHFQKEPCDYQIQVLQEILEEAKDENISNRSTEI